MGARIMAVGYDPNPSEAFKALGEVLLTRSGSEVFLATAFGKNMPLSISAIEQETRKSDLLICGMSSTVERSVAELAALRAAGDAGVPFGFFVDTLGGWNRYWFNWFLSRAAFFFVAHHADKEEIKKVNSSARIFPTGNPAWEKAVFGPPSGAVKETLGLNGYRLALVPGSKDLESNLELLAAVKAALPLLKREQVRAIFAPHPGDANDRSKYAPFLGADFSLSDLRGDEILSGADLVVSGCSPSTDFGGVLRRIPVFNVLGDATARRIEREFGTRIPPLVRQGVVFGVCGCEATLAFSVRSALTDGLFGDIRKRQEHFASVPRKKGATAERMANAILGLLASKTCAA